MFAAEVVHVASRMTSNLSVWEALAVIAASAVTVLVFLGAIARKVWRKVIGAAFERLEHMLSPNGLDSDLIGDIAKRTEESAARTEAAVHDLQKGHARLAKQITSARAALRSELHVIAERLDSHLLEAGADKAEFAARLEGKQDKEPKGTP